MLLLSLNNGFRVHSSSSVHHHFSLWLNNGLFGDIPQLVFYSPVDGQLSVWSHCWVWNGISLWVWCAAFPLVPTFLGFLVIYTFVEQQRSTQNFFMFYLSFHLFHCVAILDNNLIIRSVSYKYLFLFFFFFFWFLDDNLGSIEGFDIMKSSLFLSGCFALVSALQRLCLGEAQEKLLSFFLSNILQL